MGPAHAGRPLLVTYTAGIDIKPASRLPIRASSGTIAWSLTAEGTMARQRHLLKVWPVLLVVAAAACSSGSGEASTEEPGVPATSVTDSETSTESSGGQLQAQFTQSGYAYTLEVQFLSPTRDDDPSACIVGAARTADSVAIPFVVRFTNDSADPHAPTPALEVNGPIATRPSDIPGETLDGEALVRDGDGECGYETGSFYESQYMDPDATVETRGSVVVLPERAGEDNGVIEFTQGYDQVLRAPIPSP